MKARKKTKVENAISRYWSKFGGSYNSVSEFEKDITKKTDKRYLEAIFDEMDQRGQGKTDGLSFYRLKNSSYEGSIALSMFFYGDLYYKISKYLYKFKDTLTGDILDIGCDNGLFTCFIAKIHPDSKVVGIDVCSEAIDNAKKLAESLHLNNIEFVNTSLKDVQGKYDTLISLCTAHENLIDFELSRFDPIILNGEKYAASIDTFVKEVCGASKEDAIFYNIDKNNIEAQQLGLMRSFEINDINILDLKRIHSLEGVDKSAFCITAGYLGSIDEQEGADQQEDADVVLNAYEMFNFFLAKEEGINGNEPQYEGLLAQLYYQNSVRDTVLAYQFFFEETQIALIGLFNDDDPTSVLLYEVVWNEEAEDLSYKLYNYDISEKDNLIAEIQRAEKEYEKNGFSVRQYVFPVEQILSEEQRDLVLRIRETKANME